MRTIALLILTISILGAAEDAVDPTTEMIAELHRQFTELQKVQSQQMEVIQKQSEEIHLLSEHLQLYLRVLSGIVLLQPGVDDLADVPDSQRFEIIAGLLQGLGADVGDRDAYLQAANRLIFFHRQREEKERKRIEEFQKRKAQDEGR